MSNLFETGAFVSHSGLDLDWKINCDALSDEDIKCLAAVIAKRIGRFGFVYGIPSGGTRLAIALRAYADNKTMVGVIVDDVLTTGKSMLDAMKTKYRSKAMKVVCFVIFARGELPENVQALFICTNGVPEDMLR